MTDLRKALSVSRFSTVALDSSDTRIKVFGDNDNSSADRIYIDAVTYLQRDTPNRNFVRFNSDNLEAIALSGIGSPFLKDHNQSQLDARGGTVVDSYVATDDDGNQIIKQRIELSKEWAKEGVLDGTIDRFSIGWIPKGPVTYRHNGEEVGASNKFQSPEYWPGEKLESGEIVEWVFHDADLIEVSGVNVPAVTGTVIESIQTTLSLNLSEGVFLQPTERDECRKGNRPMEKVLSSLGLNESASEDKALEAISEVQASNATLSVENEALKTQLQTANSELEEYRLNEAKRTEAKLESDIEALYECGKLTRVNGSEPDVMEAHLRKLHAVGGQELFATHIELLRTKEALGASQSVGTEVDEGRKTIAPDRAIRLRSAGMSEERFLELDAKHRDRIKAKWGIK